MLRGYKYRLYPNAHQRAMIDKTLDACRFVRNLALETKIAAYRYAANKTYLSAIDLINQLPELKESCPWLCGADSQALQASVRDVDVSFKNFRDGRGFPRFKKKTGEQKFRCPNGKREIDFEEETITIPKIVGIRASIDRAFDGQIKSITISRTATGKYFASILVDDKKEPPAKKPISRETAIGFDLGLKSFIVTSDGNKINAPRYLKNTLSRIKALQRRMRNKKRGSNNIKKAYRKIALLHERAANQRRDFLHQESRKLVNSHDSFAHEDLNISGMSRRCKPKKNEDGKFLPNGQSAKSGLNKSILDAAWGEFVRQVRYKAEQDGKNILQVPRFFPSTKKCSCCGAINNSLTLADREWACPKCGAKHDRDKNAATNIEQYFFTSGEGIPRAPAERPAMKGRVEAGSLP